MKASLGKKLLSGLLTATLVLSMTAPAMAAKESTPTKSQTTPTFKTNNVKKGQNKVSPQVKEIPKVAPATVEAKPNQVATRRENLRIQHAKTAQRNYAPDRVIVKFKSGLSVKDLGSNVSSLNLQIDKKLGFTGAQLMKIGNGNSVDEVIRTLKKSKAIEYVQPDYILYPSDITVSDPLYPKEWGLKNIGQVINNNPTGGTPGIDINAETAWQTTQGSDSVVVAVIDTGIDYNHPDLASQMWHNPGDTTFDGVDNDGNGYIDDVYGFDFYNYTGNVYNPYDGDEHGTHVAGTIAASANTTGVIGVAPNVKIMSLKFLGPNGGFTSAAIEALDYAKNKSVKIANNSWGGVAPQDNYALENAIAASGILFVAAAGNEYNNNDNIPAYPASYPEDNIVSVAAVDNEGYKAGFSNYGYNSVDVAAPGVDIFSTVPKKEATAASLEVSGISSTTSNPYKAIVQGFGLQEFSSEATKKDIMKKAMDYFGVTTTDSILLVDDEDVGYNASYLQDYQTALTGYNVTTLSVPSDATGPLPAALNTYKAVIWFTGDSFGNIEYPLTDSDINNLDDYLNNGGNLFLSGPDILYGNEESSLVANMLHTIVVSDGESRTTMNGLANTAYAGTTYTLDSNLNPFNDQLWSSDYNSAKANLTWPAESDYSTAYRYMSGTSMAAPHVTGTAALIMSAHPEYTIYDVKHCIMATTRFLPNLVGTVMTNGIINAGAAVNYSPDDDLPGVDFYSFPKGPIVGTLDQDKDLDDVYRIWLNKGEKIQATMHSTGNDFDLYLYGPQAHTVKTSEGIVAASENAGTSEETITFIAPDSGPYFLDAYGYAGSGPYTLDVALGNQAGTYENDNPSLSYFGNAAGVGGTTPFSLPKTVPNSSPYSLPTSTPTSTLTSSSTSTSLPTSVPIPPSDTWSTVSDPIASGGSYAWTNSPYSGVEFEFSGSGIRYNAMKNSEQGIAKIWVDGHNYTADLYSTTPRSGTVFEKLDLFNGMHYIVIEWSGMSSRLGRKTNTKINLDSLEVISDTTPPAKPTGLTGSLDANNHANLTWNPNTESDLGGYVVYRGQGTNPTSWDWINSGPTFPNKTTSYVDTTVTIDPSTPYSYKITALDKAYNESEPSNRITLPDARPTNLQATVSNGIVQLTWTASPLSTVTGYQVYRGNQGAGKAQITTTPVSGTSYTDPGLAPGTYWYEVRSVLANGDLSINSQEVSVTVTAQDTTPPATPTGLQGTIDSNNHASLSWNANTEADLAGYLLQRAPGTNPLDSAFTTITAAPIIGTSYIDMELTITSPYSYRLKAIDQGTNTSLPTVYVTLDPAQNSGSTTRYEETSPNVTFSANWKVHSNTGNSGGTAKYSNTTGSYVTFTFTGSSVKWLGYGSTGNGIAKITIDNDTTNSETIDTYSATNQFKKVFYEKNGLAYAQHTIKIEVTGLKNSSGANGTYLSIDAFDIPVNIQPERYEETSPNAAFSANWKVQSNTGNSDGTAKYSNTTGSYVTFTFTGSSVKWLGYGSTGNGIAKITIDNDTTNSETIDTYSATNQFKKVFYEKNGLAYAQHTIKIEVTGLKNSSGATGTYLSVDAYDINF